MRTLRNPAARLGDVQRDRAGFGGGVTRGLVTSVTGFYNIAPDYARTYKRYGSSRRLARKRDGQVFIGQTQSVDFASARRPSLLATCEHRDGDRGHRTRTSQSHATSRVSMIETCPQRPTS